MEKKLMRGWLWSVSPPQRWGFFDLLKLLDKAADDIINLHANS